MNTKRIQNIHLRDLIIIPILAIIITGCNIKYDLADELASREEQKVLDATSDKHWRLINNSIDLDNSGDYYSLSVNKNVPYLAFINQNNLPSVVKFKYGLTFPVGNQEINSSSNGIDATTDNKFFLKVTGAGIEIPHLAFYSQPSYYVMVTESWFEYDTSRDTIFNMSFDAYENDFYVGYCFLDNTDSYTKAAVGYYEGSSMINQLVNEIHIKQCAIQYYNNSIYMALYRRENTDHRIMVKQFDGATWSIVDSGNATYTISGAAGSDIIKNLNFKMYNNDGTDDLYLAFERFDATTDVTVSVLKYNYANTQFEILDNLELIDARLNYEKALDVFKNKVYLAYTSIPGKPNATTGTPSLTYHDGTSWTNFGDSPSINKSDAYDISVVCDSLGHPYIGYIDNTNNTSIKIYTYH